MWESFKIRRESYSLTMIFTFCNTSIALDLGILMIDVYYFMIRLKWTRRQLRPPMCEFFFSGWLNYTDKLCPSDRLHFLVNTSKSTVFNRWVIAETCSVESMLLEFLPINQLKMHFPYCFYPEINNFIKGSNQTYTRMFANVRVH